MFFKLAARNVKRSFKDYFIYFLTLTFAVCIFYSFNSLSNQEAMNQLTSSQREMLKVLAELISAVSIFVSIVLGFLIIFANNFLIKRRKKELGMYMTLGMSKYKISSILVMETLFVGMFSLLAGLLFGIVISQGLSVLTVSMFSANISKFEFVFASEALVKTILYFSIIFGFVMVFNGFIISRYKLIDLLTASKKNESLKVRKTSTSIVLFLLSVILLGTAYGLMMYYGLMKSMTLMWTCIGLGSLGTFLFFMSLSGFALNMLQRNKNIYFKNVNMFVLRQINSKVNTTFISMTIICLMLFFTIGVLSTAFSLKNAADKEIDQAAPFDASLAIYIHEEDKVQNVEEAVKLLNLDLNKYGENHFFSVYESDTNLKALFAPSKNKKTEKMLEFIGDSKIQVLKKSDFDKIMSMQGETKMDLKKNEAILISNPKFVEDVENYIEDKGKIELNKQSYTISREKIHGIAYSTDYSGTMLTVVLPDQAVKDMKEISSVVNINYKNNKEKYDEELFKVLDEFMKTDSYEKYGFTLLGYTKQLIADLSVGSSTTVVFIGIYLGVVFLISSAAVLALQQLSEASDNISRYVMLKKIGVSKTGINKAIFRQVFIYFMMPLSLAIVHSIFGIQVVNKAIMLVGSSSVLLPSFITAIIMIIVYGGYFLATYTGYKGIVK